MAIFWDLNGYRIKTFWFWELAIQHLNLKIGNRGSACNYSYAFYSYLVFSYVFVNILSFNKTIRDNQMVWNIFRTDSMYTSIFFGVFIPNKMDHLVSTTNSKFSNLLSLQIFLSSFSSLSIFLQTFI